MTATLPAVEREFFRALNAVVEPAVRRGFASSRLAPLSLIVLETTGYRSGLRRRTPLWSCRIGPYRVVSTARGRRSFWVRNLQRQQRIRYHVGGRAIAATAIVVAPGFEDQLTRSSPALLHALLGCLRRFPLPGWAFAVLVEDAGAANG